jgi:hypothetical protein
MKSLFQWYGAAGVLAMAFTATPVTASDVTLFYNSHQFDKATGSPCRSRPTQPTRTSRSAPTCRLQRTATPGVDAPFREYHPTANIQLPRPTRLCFLGPEGTAVSRTSTRPP